MVLLTEKQKNIIHELFPDISEELFNGERRELLIKIDDLILKVGFTDKTYDELNNKGKELQLLRNKIYLQNKYPEDYPI